MKVPFRARPGGGFLVVVIGLAGAVTFFVWGVSTPPLETGWRMQIELLVGRREPLRDYELRLLHKTLVKNPALAENMLNGAQADLISANARGLVENGYAYVVRRTPDAPAELEVTPAGLAVDKAVEVHVRIAGADSRSGEATRAAPYSTTLPQAGSFPQVIEIRAGSQKQTDKGSPPAVSVRLGSAK